MQETGDEQVLVSTDHLSTQVRLEELTRVDMMVCLPERIKI